MLWVGWSMSHCRLITVGRCGRHPARSRRRGRADFAHVALPSPRYMSSRMPTTSAMNEIIVAVSRTVSPCAICDLPSSRSCTSRPEQVAAPRRRRTGCAWSCRGTARPRARSRRPGSAAVGLAQGAQRVGDREHRAHLVVGEVPGEQEVRRRAARGGPARPTGRQPPRSPSHVPSWGRCPSLGSGPDRRTCVGHPAYHRAMAASRLVSNPHADRDRVPPGRHPAPYLHASLPGFAPTPALRPVGRRAAGRGQVWSRTSRSRMGMPSFKILGASWATYRAVLPARLGRRAGTDPDARRAARGRALGRRPADARRRHRRQPRPRGRADGRAARPPGRILVPAGMAAQPHRRGSPARAPRCAWSTATYDDAIAASAAPTTAPRRRRDTSWEGYTEVPAGSSTATARCSPRSRPRSTRRAAEPTVVAAQIGVGALSAASCGPSRAAGPAARRCRTDRRRLRHRQRAPGGRSSHPRPQDSIMAGLNCGTPSPGRVRHQPARLSTAFVTDRRRLRRGCRAPPPRRRHRRGRERRGRSGRPARTGSGPGTHGIRRRPRRAHRAPDRPGELVRRIIGE